MLFLIIKETRMIPLPNINHLYYFWTIAKEGSIKKASRKLHLTQPGLSLQLKNLENYFGKKLFDRKVRKLILNDAGKVAVDYCNTIFNLTEEMQHSLQQIKPVKQKLVRVGVLPSLSSTHVHEFVVPLWNDKSLSVSVSEGNLEELLFLLESKNLEIVLSDREVMRRKKKISNFRLRPRKIIAVGNSNFSFARKNFPKSLNNVPMIQFTRHSQIRAEIDQYLDDNEIRPQIVGEADDVALLCLAAVQGNAIAVLPQNAVKEPLAQGSLIKLGELKNMKSDMWALVREDSRNIKVVEKTIARFRSKD